MTKQSAPESEVDETKFNETLKRMLKTPPQPHEKAAKDKLARTTKKSTKSAKKD